MLSVTWHIPYFTLVHKAAFLIAIYLLGMCLIFVVNPFWSFTSTRWFWSLALPSQGGFAPSPQPGHCAFIIPLSGFSTSEGDMDIVCVVRVYLTATASIRKTGSLCHSWWSQLPCPPFLAGLGSPKFCFHVFFNSSSPLSWTTFEHPNRFWILWPPMNKK